ncbi:MAG: hypothetical protein U1E83_01660 [Methylotetracoccus sp.]
MHAEPELHALSDRFRPMLSAAMDRFKLGRDAFRRLGRYYLMTAAWIAEARGSDRIIGITGAQGSGKSTCAALLSLILEHGFGLRAVTVSLDDLYLTRAERARLASDVHPLLKTRGVPGTHDLELGSALLRQLLAAGPTDDTWIPVFDKGLDDRKPVSEWRRFTGRPDIILLEGWCVGARPQRPDELIPPVNVLEANEDRDGTWRRYVNERLRTDYAEFFDAVRRLAMLQVPDMAHVLAWREQAEQELRATGTPQAMGRAELRRFVMHFERLTRHMLSDLPGRADLVLSLDEHHDISRLNINGAS